MSTLKEPTLTPADRDTVDPHIVTISGYVADECYGPESVQTRSPDGPPRPPDRIGRPGEFPYTRRIHKTMYRLRLCTTPPFAGFLFAADPKTSRDE